MYMRQTIIKYTLYFFVLTETTHLFKCLPRSLISNWSRFSNPASLPPATQPCTNTESGKRSTTVTESASNDIELNTILPNVNRTDSNGVEANNKQYIVVRSISFDDSCTSLQNRIEMNDNEDEKLEFINELQMCPKKKSLKRCFSLNSFHELKSSLV